MLHAILAVLTMVLEMHRESAKTCSHIYMTCCLKNLRKDDFQLARRHGRLLLDCCIWPHIYSVAGASCGLIIGTNTSPCTGSRRVKLRSRNKIWMMSLCYPYQSMYRLIFQIPISRKNWWFVRMHERSVCGCQQSSNQWRIYRPSSLDSCPGLLVTRYGSPDEVPRRPQPTKWRPVQTKQGNQRLLALLPRLWKILGSATGSNSVTFALLWRKIVVFVTLNVCFWNHLSFFC